LGQLKSLKKIKTKENLLRAAEERDVFYED
jgi:hypothetical protein